MDNLKTIITLNDYNIGLTLFNSEETDNTIYFQNKIRVPYGIIKNGFINELPWVYENLKKLISDAIDFSSVQIIEAYISIAVNEIFIRPFEINDISLPNGVFNSTEWQQLKKTMNVNQNASKYIYDIEYESWAIDNRIHHDVNSQIIGSKLDIKARMFQTNKALYQQYLNLFERLNIKVISMRPVINDLVNLTDSNKKQHAELFVLLGESSLCLMQTNGHRIEHCVTSNELGIDNLYHLLANEMHMHEKDIINLVHQVWAHFGDLNSIQIINNSISNFAEQHMADSKKFNDIIAGYIKMLVEFVETNAQYLIEQKQIMIKKISYISIARFTTRLFNLISIYSKFNLTIIPDNPWLDEFGCEYMQDWLLMNSIKKIFMIQRHTAEQPMKLMKPVIKIMKPKENIN